jgi:DNA-binding NtrC family response regulator
MPHSETSVTVLLVSPFDEDREELRRMFNGFGHFDWRIRLTRTCQEAWMALREEQVDAVIAERDFPDGLTWRELLGEVADMGALLPVIVATRRADHRLWAEFLSLGGYDLLMKPFEPEETVRVLAMAVRRAQKARQARPRRAVAAAFA